MNVTSPDDGAHFDASTHSLYFVSHSSNKFNMDKHDLIHDFPQLADKIHSLKVSDTHFRKLFDEYHDLTHEAHRIETGAEAASDDRLNEIRHRRAHLKDELYAMLTR